MRITVASLALLSALLAGCPADLNTVCGQPTTLPELDDGFGAATRSDSEDFNEQATWAPGSSASVTIGTLDLIVAKDTTGSDFDTLVEDGALPFCVPIGERSDSSGSATFNEGSAAYLTDANHSGNVAVLALEDDILIGRFSVELAESGGGASLSFNDGAFRARRR